MSNVSIYDKNWTDLVFEDKNKAYGAYQLRQENSRTTLLAFFVGSALILALIGSWLLLSSFAEKSTVPPIDEGTIIEVTGYNPPKNEEPEKKEAVAPLKKEEPTKDIDKKNLENYKMVKPEDNPDDIKTNKELKEDPSDSKTDAGSPTGTKPFLNDGGGTATSGSKPSENGGGTEVKSMAVLDRLPAYPGGIKKFYEYVLNNVEQSKFENNSGIVSVMMAFVIEKDGSMTDIRVVRSTDKTLEKEAIRVLKSLKVKWEPGWLNGDKVRTQYTLPIKVDLN